MKDRRENIWCENENGTWNEKDAEMQLMFIRQFVRLLEGGFNDDFYRIMKEAISDEDLREKAIAAAMEMYEIITNKNNASGYCINHITSGVYEYFIVDMNRTGKVPETCYATREEAELEASKYEDVYVLDIPTEEYYIVVNTKTGKRAFELLFPYEERALTFLYKRAMPEAWEAFVTANGKKVWKEAV